MLDPKSVSGNILFPIYLHELIWLTESIIENCECVFKEALIPEKGYFIQVDPKLHSKINDILISSANIAKLITGQARKKSETDSLFKCRKFRADTIKELLIDIDLTEITNKQVRNSIEHFEEYLDKMLLKNIKGQKPHDIIAYNMTISHWEVTEPKAYPMRLYVASEKKFYNMNYVIDIQKLYQEAIEIHTRIIKYLDNIENAGGMLISCK